MVAQSFIILYAYKRRVRLRIVFGHIHAENIQMLTMEMMGLL